MTLSMFGMKKRKRNVPAKYKVHRDYIRRALDSYGVDLPRYIKERYARLLEMRAVAFYVDNYLDSYVIEEDLYEEDGKFPNLDYSLEKAKEQMDL